MGRGTRGSVGVVVALALAALAGCTGSEPRTPSPSSSTASSPSTSPSAPSATESAPPELPEAATTGDAAGAEAFVKHWVDALNYAYQTGDTEPLRAISESGCQTCSDLSDEIEERRCSGKRLEGGLAVVDLVRSPPPEKGIVSVSAQLTQAEGQLVADDGSTETVAAEPPSNLGFVAAFEEGRWMLAGIGTE